jgi:hypothetical protein
MPMLLPPRGRTNTRLRVCVYVFITVCKRSNKHTLCVFITAGPITKLCAWGEEESGGPILGVLS